MRARELLLVALVAMAAMACDVGSEAAFTANHSFVSCLQNIPACPGEFALCSLNSTTYTQQTFPDASPFNFLVSALPGEYIVVTLYFVTEQDTGLSTNIYWNEPGCYDAYVYRSDGADLFQEAKDTGTITRQEPVYDGGDHMITIDTDMRAVVDIEVDVTVPQVAQ